MPALPVRIPGLARAADVVAAQTRALAQLPRTLREFNRAVLALVEAFGSARVTMATMAEVTARIERVTTELEEPLLAMRPGLERLARILDDPAVETLPETLRSINEDVLPLVQGLRDTQSRVNSLATVLPGASLLFPRRPRSGDRSAGPEDVAAGPTIEVVVEPGDEPVDDD